MAEMTPQQQNLLRYLVPLLQAKESAQAAVGPSALGTVLDMILPSSQTVEKMSYGDMPFRMPTQSRIPITTDKQYLADLIGVAGALTPAAKPVQRGVQQLVREIQTTAPRGQIAYHGTNKDFDKYRVKNRGLAYYFTPDPEQASFYSGMGEGANVRPVDLDLNKTYRGGQVDEIMEVVKKEDDYYPYSLSKIKESLENKTPLAFHTPSVIKALKQKGYDSFVEYENGVEQIGVFSNKNIKPAFGTGGLLDQQPENLEKIYHGTSPKAAKQIESAGFNINKSADGTIWFTSNPQIGEVAATGKGAVVERLIDLNKLKLGGWDETDKFSVDELISQGFDGLRLVDGDEITYQIFNPEKLKKPLK